MTVSSRTIKLVIEYDGTGLCGWQRQKNDPTVQQHLEEALAEMIGQPVSVIGASRTDAGVHAEGQVACFTTDSTIPLVGFRLGLNPKLPAQIAVRSAEQVDASFHARFSARGKHYRYQILARRPPSPLLARSSWHRPRPLDTGLMRSAAADLVGEHDFQSFRASGCGAKTTTRTITAIEVQREGDVVIIHVRGTAFLRNMVRILAGTLVEIGEGRRPADSLPDVLASRDRTTAGQTAPAPGLTLVEVFYG